MLATSIRICEMHMPIVNGPIGQDMPPELIDELEGGTATGTDDMDCRENDYSRRERELLNPSSDWHDNDKMGRWISQGS